MAAYRPPMDAYRQYRQAVTLLYGEAGTFLADEFERLNATYFDDELPPMRLVIGLMAYGRCIGLTRHHDVPRISIASKLFAEGLGEVSDTMLHEMVHANLMLKGESPWHNGTPWCGEITRISKTCGFDIVAKPVHPRRVPNPERNANPRAAKTKVVREPEEGALTRKELGRWPHCLPDPGIHRSDRRTISVDRY
jgi:hypothetical protein